MMLKRLTGLLLCFTLTTLSTVVKRAGATHSNFWDHIAAIERRGPIDHHRVHQAHATFQSLHSRRQIGGNSASTPVSSSSSTKCTRPVARVSWYSLSATEKESWIMHFKQLHTPGKSMFIKGGSYMDDLAIVHIGLQTEMHYNACFLVCHAAFIRAFYTLMRLTGYRGKEVYWPIENDARRGIQNAGLWRDFGSDDGKGGPIPNGPFRGISCGVLPDTKSPGRSIYKPHSVTRHFNDDWNKRPMVKGDMYSSLMQAPLWNEIMAATSYTAFRQKLERTLHAYIHQSMGGEMWLFSAVCEPTFWLLHAEIDRVWRSWQSQSPRGQDRWSEYGGHKRINQNGNVVIVEASLDDTIDFYGMFEKIKVRDVMHPRKGILCYRYDSLLNGVVDNK